MKKQVAKVGIVGGGAAGVITAKWLRDAGHTVVIFEKSTQLGGVWKYEEATNTDSSMYESLRTNLPTSVMQLHDFPFPPGLPSFVGHLDVLRYVQDYARHYRVTDVVRYKTTVRRFEKQPSLNDPAAPIWRVELDSEELGTYTERVDKVVICNGHFAVPFYPPIAGIENFEGQKLHSHDYRTPASFRDKRVLLVGCGPSGQDISLELARSGAKQVTVAFKEFGDRPKASGDSRVLKPTIDHVRPGGGIVFSDGSEQDAPDVFMYCTGYLYTATSFGPPEIFSPKLDSVLANNVNKDLGDQLDQAAGAGSVIAPLYRQLFSIEEPDIVFIGLPFKNIPFLCFELQAKWAARVFSGDLNLPSKAGMYQTFHEELTTLPFPVRKLHQLGLERQKDYFEKLAAYSGTVCDPAVQAMFEDAGFLRSTYPLNYRDAEYTKVEGRWVRRFIVQDETQARDIELIRAFE